MNQDLRESCIWDNELITRIESYIKSKNFDCYLLEVNQAKEIIENLAKVYHFDLSKRYLWEDVYSKQRISYDNETEVWTRLLTQLLLNFESKTYLVVTDDEFYPWAVFECQKEKIVEVIREQRHFEFFIFDKSMRFILFDTHDNELLLIFSDSSK